MNTMDCKDSHTDNAFKTSNNEVNTILDDHSLKNSNDEVNNTLKSLDNNSKETEVNKITGILRKQQENIVQEISLLDVDGLHRVREIKTGGGEENIIICVTSDRGAQDRQSIHYILYH